ncbi:MAG: toprim domain-containing protein, partial [candidate division Zixibacteria bacterium]|nr:toprim domain-containing protein [candidate division Zixibacteria bacterium]
MENEKIVPQDVIDNVKRSVDLIAYVQSRGIKLVKNGKEYKGLCPFHKDTNPSFSVNPVRQLWICFSCDTGGDVIKFVQKMDKLSFHEAVYKLSGADASAPHKQQSVRTYSQVELLTRTFDFYQQTFNKDNRGRLYLHDRGIGSTQLFKTIRLGFANGSLMDVLPGDIKKQLQSMGLLTKSGREFFGDSVVFPLVDVCGQILNLYGRSIKNKRYPHLFLPGERRGLFCPPPHGCCETVLITEGIIDALTLLDAGYQNVLAIYGVNGLTTDHLHFFQEQRVKRVILCLDGDAAGQKAVSKITEQLNSRGIDVSFIQLPEGLDINDYFQTHNKKDFQKLISGAQNKDIKPGIQEHGPKTKVIDGGFLIEFDNRSYRVLGMNMHGLDRMKVNIKIQQDKLFHIDSFDLYASRARDHFVKTSSRLLKAAEQELYREVNTLIDLLEVKRLELINDEPQQDKPEISEEERKEALRFLKSKNILKEILEDFDKCG